MSALCPLSSICTIQDVDLSFRAAKKRTDGKLHVLLHQDIDIKLHLDFIPSGQVNQKVPPESITWDSGTPDLCGSCKLCNLIQEGLSRRLKPVIPAWRLEYQSSDSGGEGVITQLKVNLQSLEYLRDPSKWVSGKNHAKHGCVFLMVLRGHAVLEQGEAILESMEVAVPFELFAEEDDPTAKCLDIHRRPLDTNTLSRANVGKILEWLKDCDETHGKCRKDLSLSNEQETTFMPTRLIDVGDLNSARHPRLVATSEALQQDSNPKYIALSYCWGPPKDSIQPLRTIISTIGTRLESISTDIMPLAFRDTVTIARTLQIQYVWIDSLCIVQDDVQDWQVESSKMAGIFSNAYLTIVAAAGASSHESFLYRPSNPAHCSIPFRPTRNLTIQGRYSLRHRPGRKWWGPDKMAEISGHSWIGRGWTFQEERLSRKVLMFGENKFFFDCRTMERAEDTAKCKSRPDWSETLYETPDARKQDETMQQGEASHSLHPTFVHWQTLCNHYSRRKLTFDKDKLAAFSGMANTISKKVDSDYLAGLWRHHLKHDLFWQTIGVTKKPDKYRAPSWSWASVDAQVQWKPSPLCVDDDCKMYCTILDAQTTISGFDSFGAVKDGYLKISGAVLEAGLLWAVDDQSPKHPWRVNIEGEEIARADLDVEKNEPLLGAKERRSWALLVAKCLGTKSSPQGLLLRKTGRQRHGLEEFQREGIFRIFPHTFQNPSNTLRTWEESPRQPIVIV